MLENQFPITAQGLAEISRRLMRSTSRFILAAVAVPVVIALLAVVICLTVPAAPPLLVGIVAVAFVLFFFRSISKVPDSMAAQLYQGMKKDDQEPIEHTHLTDTGIEILDGENTREYPYGTIRLVFGTPDYLVAMNGENRAVYWKRDAFLDGDAETLLQTLKNRCENARFL